MPDNQGTRQNDAGKSSSPLATQHQSIITKPSACSSGRDDEENRRIRRVVKLLVAMCATFAACWLPLTALNVLSDFEVIFKNDIGTLMLWFPFCHLCGVSTAVINPILYGWFNENFRHEYLHALASCCGFSGTRWGPGRRPRTTSMSSLVGGGNSILDRPPTTRNGTLQSRRQSPPVLFARYQQFSPQQSQQQQQQQPAQPQQQQNALLLQKRQSCASSSSTSSARNNSKGSNSKKLQNSEHKSSPPAAPTAAGTPPSTLRLDNFIEHQRKFSLTRKKSKLMRNNSALSAVGAATSAARHQQQERKSSSTLLISNGNKNNNSSSSKPVSPSSVSLSLSPYHSYGLLLASPCKCAA